MRIIINTTVFRYLVPVFSLGLLIITDVFGQGIKPNETQQSGWSRSANVGITMTRGNSKTFLSSGSIIAERKGGDIEVRLGLEANYGEAELTETNGTSVTENNVNDARIFTELRKTLSHRTYFYSKADALTDRIAGIDYRLIIGPGFGFYLIKNDKESLGTDIGISYIREVPNQDTENIAALRVSERYDLKISQTSKLWQSIEYMPALNDFNRFLMNAEMGLEAAINTSMSLRVVAQDKYNSEPPEEKEKNDLLMITGVAFKF
ncbi:MAG: DUF481 domain-containing protein [Kiritimatiellae bacterium]|nr:DUF481 domain-containing protein [Kiritimatiellia bacterium]